MVMDEDARGDQTPTHLIRQSAGAQVVQGQLEATILQADLDLDGDARVGRVRAGGCHGCGW